MKTISNVMVLALVCLAAMALSGCLTQTSSPLQNQYGPAAAYTRASQEPLADFWFDTRVVHPAFGMATNWNLGAQVVDQRELGNSRALGRPNPMAAVGAVDRYQKGQVRALPETSLEAGGNSE
ncbi:MAG: hypothetical protein LBF58_01260 [Deltaproteobacteria bacterium]|jgi:hypothetical protein|nr:hypothetical protein [Deltaproteobacteria bacterium]